MCCHLSPAALWDAFRSRDIYIYVPLPIDTVRENLVVQLQRYNNLPLANSPKGKVSQGNFSRVGGSGSGLARRVSRRYRGEIKGDRIIFRSTNFYYRNAASFITIGNLQQEADGTILIAKMQVPQADLLGLLFFLPMVIAFSSFFHWAAPIVGTILVGFICLGQIPLNFRKLKAEIICSLEQLMLGEAPASC